MGSVPDLLLGVQSDLMRFARKLDYMNYQDLLQDANCRILLKQHLYQPDTNFRAWCFMLMKNIFLDGKRRAAAHTIQSYDYLMTTSESVHVEPQTQAHDEAPDVEVVLAALAKLPPKFRDLIHWLAIDGMSYEEISTKTGIPLGTVRSRIYRGRNHLAGLMTGVHKTITDATPIRGNTRRELAANIHG